MIEVSVRSELPPWLRPHLETIEASVRAGFRIRHLPDFANLAALQGFRIWSGAMDMYLARSADDALAARFRLVDLERPSPPALWHQQGTVADAVGALLELPPHGAPGAPRLAQSRVSELWTPRT